MLVPKLRFPEFTDPWEQRKFSDIAITRRGLTYKPSNITENGVRVLRSSNINEDTFVFGNDDVFVDVNALNIPYVQNGDILITSANGSSRLVGKHAIIRNLPDNSAVHGGFMLVASSSNPEFLNASMNSQWYSEFVSLYVTGGNGAIGNLNKNDLDIQVVLIPSEAEQQQIGTFFRNLDSLITLLQCELDALKKLKKAAMQNFFSQEVRFKRENGTDYPEWEEKILQDVSYYITTTGTGVKSVYVSTENMQKGCAGVCFDCNDDIAVKGIQYVPDDILISNIRPYLKKAWKADRKGICSTDVLCIRGTSEISSDFLYTLLSSDSFFEYVVQGVKGTKMPRGDKKHIMEMPIFIPCTEEQQKIADFLSTYDEAISYAKQELEHWKLLKKGLLQQMFV